MRLEDFQKNVNYCQNCGAPQQSGARFCPSCGKRYGASRSLSERLEDLTNWGPLASFVKTITHMLAPVNNALEHYGRKGVDALFAENYAAPSFLVWNLLAALLCSSFFGFAGILCSLRTLHLKRDHDPEASTMSKYAKLWLALAIVSFFLFRLPLFLRLH